MARYGNVLVTLRVLDRVFAHYLGIPEVSGPMHMPTVVIIPGTNTIATWKYFNFLRIISRRPIKNCEKFWKLNSLLELHLIKQQIKMVSSYFWTFLHMSICLPQKRFTHISLLVTFYLESTLISEISIIVQIFIRITAKRNRIITMQPK